jgi:hypothetical protein
MFMIDSVNLEAHGVFIYAVSSNLLMIVEMVANRPPGRQHGVPSASLAIS